jgi:hypothetical protein
VSKSPIDCFLLFKYKRRSNGDRWKKDPESEGARIMKFVTAAALIAGIAGSSYAQGLVNFNNTASTLISAFTGTANPPISGPAGSYYFGLLIAPTNVTSLSQFTFAGIYATNTGVDGMFAGGSIVSVPNWAAGTSQNYRVAGWWVGMGPYFTPAWLVDPGSAVFGVSAVGSGIAGGSAGGSNFPALDLFGGTSGLQQGFTLYPQALVPEPSTLGLLISAGIILVAKRRR